MARAHPIPAEGEAREVPASGATVRRVIPLVVILPALVAAVTFANTLWNGFVYDDPIVLRWLNTRRWDFPGLLFEKRWLTYAVHLLDRALWGSSPPGYHLTNVVLHAVVSGLAGFVAWRLSRARVVGAFTGLLFAVHPVHVEVVANVANRKDMLAMIFVLLGLLAWTEYRRTSSRLLVATACYGLALFGKEVAGAGLVLMLFCADVLLPRDAGRAPGKRARESALRLSPILILGAIVVSLVHARSPTSLFSADWITKMSDGRYDTYGQSLATGVGNLTDVFRLLVFPRHLSIDYAIEAQTSLFDARALFGLVLLGLWLAAAGLCVRRAPLATFAMLWVLLTYLPCSNLVPLHHILVAERYLYVPSFGVCLLFALGLDTALRALGRRGEANGQRLALGLAALPVVAGAWRSFVRNADWRDTPALVAAGDRDGIDTWRMHKTAGALAVRGEDFEEGLRRYTRAVELRPGDPDLQFWKAVAATEVGHVRTAVDTGRLITSMQPDNAKAHYNLGIALVQAQKVEAAIESLRTTIRLERDYVDAHFNLGVALTLQGDRVGALAAFERCAKLDERHAEAHFYRAALLADRGEHGAALAAYRLAIEKARDVALLERIATNLAGAGEEDEAIEAYRQAATLQPENATAHERVADVSRAAGRYSAAINSLVKAVALRPESVRLLKKLGATCEEGGHPEWALDAYRNAARLAPRDEALQRAVHRLRAREE